MAVVPGPFVADWLDRELLLEKCTRSVGARVARSEGLTSTEAIAYSGTPGEYRWVVLSYRESGSCTLTTTNP